MLGRKHVTILILRRENGDEDGRLPIASNDANIGLRYENIARDGGTLILAVFIMTNQDAVQDKGTLTFGPLNLWILSHRFELSLGSQSIDGRNHIIDLLNCGAADLRRRSIQARLRKPLPGRYLSAISRKFFASPPTLLILE